MLRIDEFQDILSQFGFSEKIIDIVPLQESQNTEKIRLLYLIRLEDRRKLVCRICREKNFPKELIEQQSAFSEELWKNGIPVAKKYQAYGNYCITCICDSLTCCVTLEDYAGEDLEHINLQTFEDLGVLLGKMHRISQCYPVRIDYSPITDSIQCGRARFSRILTNLDVTVRESRNVQELGEEHDILVSRLGSMLDSLPHGAVHSDVSVFNNLCVHDSKLSIIDFNLASDEPYMCDMLICLYSSIYKYSCSSRLKGIDTRSAARKFLAGYFSQCTLNASETEAFPVAAALFDGLYYCKAIIEEFETTGDKNNLIRLKSARSHFDVMNHSICDLYPFKLSGA